MTRITTRWRDTITRRWGMSGAGDSDEADLDSPALYASFSYRLGLLLTSVAIAVACFAYGAWIFGLLGLGGIVMAIPLVWRAGREILRRTPR